MAARMSILVLTAMTAVGCRQDMHDQPRHEPLEATTFFEDRRASRPPIEGTVARGQLRTDDHLYTGRVHGKLVDAFPFSVTEDLMHRGRERFGVYCMPCHDATGSGNGIVMQRGFRPLPPSFHNETMRSKTVGHYFDVITNGFGAMYAQGDKVSPRDRWAIIAYIRALYLCRNATLEDVPESPRAELKG